MPLEIFTEKHQWFAIFFYDIVFFPSCDRSGGGLFVVFFFRGRIKLESPCCTWFFLPLIFFGKSRHSRQVLVVNIFLIFPETKRKIELLMSVNSEKSSSSERYIWIVSSKRLTGADISLVPSGVHRRSIQLFKVYVLFNFRLRFIDSRLSRRTATACKCELQSCISIHNDSVLSLGA